MPQGLLEEVVAFAQKYKTDFTPIDTFMASINQIADKESDRLGLKHYEKRPTVARFMAVLKARRTLKREWSKGWPLIKYPESPNFNDWSLTYYLNNADILSSRLESPKGISGLSFGPGLRPDQTGHLEMVGARAKRCLRAATVRLLDEEKGACEFRFGVLQHRPLPEGSHIKQWQLSEVRGKLWLNLTLSVKLPVPVASPIAAGLDIGWRRTEEGIRIGVLHDPISKSFRNITLDFHRSPTDPTARTPFQWNLGPTRWEKRNITSLLPNWKPGDPVPGVVELRSNFSTRRSYLKDHAKALLRKQLGENVPAWFDKAGKKGLIALAELHKEDATVQEIVTTLVRETDALNSLTTFYSECVTRRLHYGYEQIAHDVCRYLAEKGIHRIAVESTFLSKLKNSIVDPDSDGYFALKNSQKYRQFAALGTFVQTLKHIAAKSGIVVDEIAALNTTRMCAKCGFLNESTAKQRYQCGQCQQLIDQDQNASINLSRAASAGPGETVAA